MLNDLEKNYQEIISLYKENNEDDNKNKVISMINKLDNEYTKMYLEELKKYINKTNDTNTEINRLKNIISLIKDRQEKRNVINNDIQELSLDIKLNDIPNLNKLDGLMKKLKEIESTITTPKKETEQKEEKIKILKDYYENLQYFNDLKIPNMGLIKDENKIDIDNNSYFIK